MALLALRSPVPTAPWQGRLLTLAGLALLPWTGYLAAALPPAEAAWWIALDTLEAACLLTAGSAPVRRQRTRLAASAAALLLGADACVDLLTSASGGEFVSALVMALCAELPLAGLCAALARRSPRPRTAATGGLESYEEQISSRAAAPRGTPGSCPARRAPASSCRARAR